jgi:hypothetical protein
LGKKMAHHLRHRTTNGVASPPHLALAAVAALACGLPSEEGGEIFVTLEAPSNVLVRGDSAVLVARAWHSDEEGRTTPAAGVTFQWRSENTSVATVTRRPDGTGSVVGLNPGQTEISAAPADYENGEPGRVVLRIANSIEIDQVVPRTVAYGQQVTVTGTGLGRVIRMTLGETSLIPDTTSFVGDSLGIGQQRFWVAYPATSDRLLAVAREGFSAPAADSTIVIPRDLYADLPGSPPVINLDAARAAGSGVLFSNPALALTAAGESERILHFTVTDPARPLTVTVTTYAFLPLPFLSTLASHAIDNPGSIDARWSTGLFFQHCKGGRLPTFGITAEAPPFTVSQALTQLTGPDLYLTVRGTGAGRFGVSVEEGYRTADARLTPDRLEENDHCVGADANFVAAATRTDTLPIAESLTIDNPFDFDWLRFRVEPLPTEPEFSPQLITIRAETRPFSGSDSSDINLSLVAEQLVGFESWDATVDEPGSVERMTLQVAPGDYYLMVGDGAGVPTRYALCIGRGVDCLPPP